MNFVPNPLDHFETLKSVMYECLFRAAACRFYAKVVFHCYERQVKHGVANVWTVIWASTTVDGDGIDGIRRKNCFLIFSNMLRHFSVNLRRADVPLCFFCF